MTPAATRQEMLGFGAAMTDASCWVLSQIPAEERTALMHELFAPDQMAMNVCRTCIGSSDYSKELFSYDEGDMDDPELAKFSIAHDQAYVLPMLKEARKQNPDLFLFSSPWSPPAWMKFNRSMLGGTIRKSTLEPYSRYTLKFLEAYKSAGVPIDAITVQNEVDTTVDGRYAACLWSQEDEILYVGKYLGPLFRKANCPTKIWVLDHNFTLWGRAIAETERSGSARIHRRDRVARVCRLALGNDAGTQCVSGEARVLHGRRSGPSSGAIERSADGVGLHGRNGRTMSCAIGAARSPCGMSRSTSTARRTSGSGRARAGWRPRRISSGGRRGRAPEWSRWTMGRTR
ncbi:MAG: hypothetical protein WDO73_16730 [Ignavibacteriota bacterium]